MINENLRLYLGSDRRYLCSHHGVRNVAWASDSEGPRSQSALKSRKLKKNRRTPNLANLSSIQFTRASSELCPYNSQIR